MGILTREEIVKEIEAGSIKIEPLSENQIGPASIDLTLGNHFRKFKKSSEPFAVTDFNGYEKITEEVELEDGEELILQPGEAALAVTRERISLPTNIAGWLEGRSRFARLGLMVHVSASLMQPGIDNKPVLEMVNLGGVPLKIKPGLHVCQFIFDRCEGEARYSGKFKNQIKP